MNAEPLMKVKMVLCGSNRPTTDSRVAIMAGLELSGEREPHLLHIPTAKYTQVDYNKEVGLVKESVGAIPLRALHPFGKLPTTAETTELLEWADIIYVGGGYTRHMLDQWRRAGIDQLLIRAILQGEIVATGGSAGMTGWFNSSYSSAESYELPNDKSKDYIWQYHEVSCLGLLNAIACSHYDSRHPITKIPKADSFRDFIKQKPSGTIGIGLDNSASMQIVRGSVKILSSNDSGGLHRLTKGMDNVDIADFRKNANPIHLTDLFGM
jgi:dipeptidase E